ncbi:hypothetical protein CaCOL14_012004 [Colletotrichum acutatum]
MTTGRINQVTIVSPSGPSAPRAAAEEIVLRVERATVPGDGARTAEAACRLGRLAPPWLPASHPSFPRAPFAAPGVARGPREERLAPPLQLFSVRGGRLSPDAQ